MPGFVLLIHARNDDDPVIRVGYTVTKKIGGAVVRNRMKRRFRALARAILPEQGVPGADHVIIGRAGGIERDYATLGETSPCLAKVEMIARAFSSRAAGNWSVAVLPQVPLPAFMLGLLRLRLDALWGAPRKLAASKRIFRCHPWEARAMTLSPTKDP